MVERLRRALPVLLVACGVGVAGVAAAGPGLTSGDAPLPEEEPPPPPELTEPDPAEATPPPRPVEDFLLADYPGWLTWPVTAFALALVAGALGLMLFLIVRYLLTERVARRPIAHRAGSQPGGGGLRAAEVHDAVRAGLADIDAGGDPRRAVIACWLRLERAAAAAGTARLAADTPAELVARLLAAHQVSDAALVRLADAYRLARYAPDEIGAELASQARGALAEIADQLGRAARAETVDR